MGQGRVRGPLQTEIIGLNRSDLMLQCHKKKLRGISSALNTRPHHSLMESKQCGGVINFHNDVTAVV